jgi:hypothetical protein
MNYGLWTLEVLFAGTLILGFAVGLQRVADRLDLSSQYRFGNLKLAFILVLAGPLWSMAVPSDLRSHFNFGNVLLNFFFTHRRNAFLTYTAALLLLIYFAGLLYFLRRIVRLILEAKKLMDKAEPLEVEQSFYPVYSSNDLHAPVSLGLFEPKILLPKELQTQLSPNEMRIVLAHEGVHIARRDHLFRGLSSMVFLIWYFFPLKKVISDDLESEMELSCDASLLTSGFFEPRRYGELLVSLAQIQMKNGHGIAISRSFLKKRLEAMKRFSRPRLLIQLSMRCILTIFAAGLCAMTIDTPSLYPEPKPFVSVESGDFCPDRRTCLYENVVDGQKLQMGCSSGLLNVVNAFYEAGAANLPCFNFSDSVCSGKNYCDTIDSWGILLAWLSLVQALQETQKLNSVRSAVQGLLVDIMVHMNIRL